MRGREEGRREVDRKEGWTRRDGGREKEGDSLCMCVCAFVRACVRESE